MTNEGTGTLASFPYRWGVFENNRWNEKGKLVITPVGVLLDKEMLVNTRYHAISHSLVFGGDHGSFARTGRFAFDTTQLYFNGSMEQDDGSTVHIIGFADFDVTYTTNIKPANKPTAPGKAGPTLRVSINQTAFDRPADNTVIRFILTSGKNAEDITNRVTSSNLNAVNQTFEINMGPGGPFPPTEDLFDITMATDMSGFIGTYQADTSRQYLWAGKPQSNTLATLRQTIAAAGKSLATASVPKIRNTAATALLAKANPAGLMSLDIKDGDDGPLVLQGLDAQDLAFIANMDAQGIKIATLDNIRGITSSYDSNGKLVVNDRAQKITSEAMNTASLVSLQSPWREDFNLQPPPLDGAADAVRLANLDFFSNNADLQMGYLLKYKQDDFSGVDQDAIKTVSKPKLDATWKLNSMDPTRLQGYMKASTDMYGYAYAQVAGEFQAYLDGDREAWARAYFNWLTDPSQLSVWQKQFGLMTGDMVAVWIYEWHAKLSILAPDKPYAAQIEAYALSSFLTEQAISANWVADALPILSAAITEAAKTNTQTASATGQDLSDPNAPFIQQMLAGLMNSVGSDIASAAISTAALAWQKANPKGGPYYAYLYTNADALGAIAAQMDATSAAAFTTWAAKATSGNSATTPGAREILAYCVYAAITGFLLAGLAPKSTASSAKQAAGDPPPPPNIAWILKGIKIGQVVINSAAAAFQVIFSQRIALLWTQYAGEEGEAAPGLTAALTALSDAVEDGELVFGWGLAFLGGLSKFLSVAGPILALVGIGLSIYNIYKDFLANRPMDVELDILGAITAIIGVGVTLTVVAGLITAATAGPIGLVIAVIGLIILAFKMLWDFLFPTPTPIQQFVAGPLTTLGVVDPATSLLKTGI